MVRQGGSNRKAAEIGRSDRMASVAAAEAVTQMGYLSQNLSARVGRNSRINIGRVRTQPFALSLSPRARSLSLSKSLSLSHPHTLSLSLSLTLYHLLSLALSNLHTHELVFTFIPTTQHTSFSYSISFCSFSTLILQSLLLSVKLPRLLIYFSSLCTHTLGNVQAHPHVKTPTSTHAHTQTLGNTHTQPNR